MGVDPYAHLSLAEDLQTAADFIRATALHSSSEIMLSFACHIEARLAHVEKQEQPSYLRSGFDVYRALTGPLGPTVPSGGDGESDPLGGTRP